MPINKKDQALSEQDKLLIDFREISLRGSQIYSGGYGIPDYNPDTLVSRKGLDIYNQMRKDDQIKAVLTMKKYARLMTPWMIQPASQDSKDIEIADFVKTNIDNLAGTFEDNLLEIYSALDFGFSITEKIWYRIGKGKYAGKIGLKSLKTREPFYYAFESDAFGNLRENGIIYQGSVPYDLQATVEDRNIRTVIKNSPQFGYKLPVDKFIVYSYNKEFNNYYGNSDLRAAYRCYSEDTEVLTDNGWKQIKDVNMQIDLIATLNPKTNVLEYHKPDKKFEYDYTGNLYNIANNNIDMLVTPNHQLWAKIGEENYKFISADTLPKRAAFKRDAFWIGEDKEFSELPLSVVDKNMLPTRHLLTDNWLKILGIWLTYGTIYQSGSGKNTRYIICIVQKNKKILKLIEQCIKDCGFNYIFKKEGKEISGIEIYSSQLYDYFSLCTNHFLKFIPKNIKQLCVRQLSILVDALMLGSKKEQYCTVSEKMADDLQEILIKLGYGTTKIYKSWKKGCHFDAYWEINFTKKNINKDKSITKVINYTGKVYCLEVKNHIMLVRRNGKPVWCGNSWWSKEILIRFFNVYMERFGMPTLVAKYPKGLQKTTRTILQSILDNVQSKYVLTIPNDISIEVLAAVSGGESAYKSAIEMHNRSISRSILVPDLMGFNELSGGGSYALGKKHFDVFLWVLQKLGKDTEEDLVGEQLIKQLVDYNYNNVDTYPKFKFENITAEGTAVRANIIQMGVIGGFINPQEEWIREYLSIPKKESNIRLGVPLSQQTLSDIETDEKLKDSEDKLITSMKTETGLTEEDIEEQSEQFTLHPKYYKAIQIWKQRQGYKQHRAKVPAEDRYNTKQYQSDKLPLDIRFDYKLDFKKIELDLNDYEKESVEGISKIITWQKESFLKNVARKKIIENKDYKAIDTLQLKYVGDLKHELHKRLIKLYLDSKLSALLEIAQGAENTIQIVTKFANAIIQAWIPVEATEAIDFFNRKVIAKIIKSDGTKKLLVLATRKELQYYDAKAFAIAGIERDNILKQAQFILLEGIKTGDFKNTQYALGTIFDKYLETGELKDDELVTPYRLETIVRTNFSEAYNAGRKAMMDDPDVKELIPYKQYKAILDSRTREAHAEMHNKIYRSDNPIWEQITPPNGYNCRCIVVPITKFEVERLINKGDGIELADNMPLPENFPDIGFGKYTQELKEASVKEYNYYN